MKFYWYDSERFFKKGARAKGTSTMAFPAVLLIKDSWDDMGWKTTFRFRYYIDAESYFVDEQINILHKDERETTLPESPFEFLPADYYMIGGTLEFYEELIKLEDVVWREMLLNLRDVVFTQFPEDLENLAGFKTSMLRSSEAEKVFREPKTIFPWKQSRGDAILRFEYTTRLPGADSAHNVTFDFAPSPSGLNRINVLIGKNGTGKTQLLGAFANAMSGLKLRNAGHFTPRRPSFNRVIAISYSAFDEFSRPNEKEEKSFSYKYCGIWEKDQLLTKAQMRRKFTSALAQVVADGRLNALLDILRELIGETLVSDAFANPDSKELVSYFRSLSSGQSILVLILTQVVAYIRPASILLYDEPELHLHPDAVNGLLRSLHKLLTIFDSYAIVATHSPILLQEIPSAYVRIFRRFGNTPLINKIGIECFGENLTRITEEVFESDGSDNNFRRYLRHLVQQGNSIEVIQSYFDNKLSLNARAFLASIEPSPDADEIV